MPNRLSIYAIHIVACLSLLSPVVTSGNSYSGKGWNVTLVDSCGIPDNSDNTHPIKWADEFKKSELIFTLRKNDFGKCSTDLDARHNAPFWERVEVRQEGNLEAGKNYSIKFDLKFIEGFNSERETFFQLHASNNKCSAAPVLMMKFNYGKLVIEILGNISKTNVNGNHRNKYEGELSIRDLKGYQSFEVIIDQDKKYITVYKNGEKLINRKKYEQKKCGKLYAKFGIYRPGNDKSKTSISSYKNIKIKEVNDKHLKHTIYKDQFKIF